MNLSTVLLLAITRFTPQAPPQATGVRVTVPAVAAPHTEAPPPAVVIVPKPVVEVASLGAAAPATQPRAIAPPPAHTAITPVVATPDAPGADPSITLTVAPEGPSNANICSHIAARNRDLEVGTIRQYADWISRESEKHAVPAAMLTALLSLESSFNREARSPSGALGLAQLMPETAADLGVTDPFDPEQSIAACATLIGRYREAWKGSADRDRLAIASYRIGYNAVSEAGQIPTDIEPFVDNVLGWSKAIALGVDLPPLR